MMTFELCVWDFLDTLQWQRLKSHICCEYHVIITILTSDLVKQHCKTLSSTNTKSLWKLKNEGTAVLLTMICPSVVQHLVSLHSPQVNWAWNVDPKHPKCRKHMEKFHRVNYVNIKMYVYVLLYFNVIWCTGTTHRGSISTIHIRANDVPTKTTSWMYRLCHHVI